MVRRLGVWMLAASATAGCQSVPPQPPGAPRPTVTVEEPEAWRGIASARDAAALDGLAARWDQALASTRSAGFQRRVAAEGPLLLRGAGLARAAPAPGSYRCRFIRLGSSKWTVSSQGYCYIGLEGSQLSLATELRGLRLGGYLWELKGGSRLVFLGAAVPAGAKIAPAYSEVPTADSAGLVERVGDFRYRLVLPEPPPGRGLTIVEMIAAPRA